MAQRGRAGVSRGPMPCYPEMLCWKPSGGWKPGSKRKHRRCSIRNYLPRCTDKLAIEWDVAADPAEDAAFGRSIADWPAFPDTVEALRYLKQHFRLVILSNVDRSSFAATNDRLGVAFDAIYTAQDIGSYKPDRRNFLYLVDRVTEQGIPKDRMLHVAQSLFHDHVPAQALGIASAWIDRRHDASGWGATAPVPPDVRYDFRFTSLGALADAHRLGW